MPTNLITYMTKSLKHTTCPKLTPEEIDTPNTPVSILKIESIAFTNKMLD